MAGIAGYKGERIKRVPTEDDEMMVFHQWLQLRKIPHFHCPNEVGGSTRGVKARAIKMKKLGVSRGVPDLFVFIPIMGQTGEPDAYQPVAIEMKRTKGSSTSAEQKEWLSTLEMAGIPGAVCKGAEKAIQTIEEIEKEIRNEGY